MYLLALLIFACFILLAVFVIGQVPSPHNVEGKIYTNDSNGVQNGIPVLINNTATGDNKTLTYVNAPPAVPHRGSYSATIIGNDNDLIVVTSWNRTHFGNNTAPLGSRATVVDVILNMTRPSEANVTILEPLNNSPKNKSLVFNVTVNITILGSDGIDCNATISFSDNYVMNITPDENFTHVLGDIPFEGYKLTNWTVKGLKDGASNISVSARCDSDGRNFEHLDTDTTHNITIQNLPPAVGDLVIVDMIDLIAGSNLTVYCNASVNDTNLVTDIRVVNGTFYQQSVGANAADDNNDHYSNSSCINVSSSKFQSNYSCSFNVAYYANNGTWFCNISAFDDVNATDFDNINTSINELLAIDVSPLIIDYGRLQVSNISNDFKARK